MKDLCASILSAIMLLVALVPVTGAHSLPPWPQTSEQSCSSLKHHVTSILTLLTTSNSGGVCRSTLSSGSTVYYSYYDDLPRVVIPLISTCSGTTDCIIAAVKLLQPCVRGETVELACSVGTLKVTILSEQRTSKIHPEVFLIQIVTGQRQRQCLCDGLHKILDMARIVKTIVCPHGRGGSNIVRHRKLVQILLMLLR